MKGMENLFYALGIWTVLDLLVKHFKSIKNYVMKTEEEERESLLKTEEDKIKFQNTIASMLRNNIKTKKININNKEIEITI